MRNSLCADYYLLSSDEHHGVRQAVIVGDVEHEGRVFLYGYIVHLTEPILDLVQAALDELLCYGWQWKTLEFFGNLNLKLLPDEIQKNHRPI